MFGEGEILSVQYKEKPVVDAPQDILKTLASKIKALQNKRQGLIDRKRILQNKATFLGAFLDFSKTQIPKELQTQFPTVEDLGKTLAFLIPVVEYLQRKTYKPAQVAALIRCRQPFIASMNDLPSSA